MNRIILLLPFLLFSFFLNASSESDPNRVSMVELIVNPEKWDGKIVSVTGYMNFQYEGDAIFLHKEDADNWIQINGIGLLLKYDNEHNLLRKDINQKELNHKYATVTGTFKLVSRDVLYFRGDITNIESIR